jgi:hypothetical protein
VPDFLMDHRTGVDLRILFQQSDWDAYCADLKTVEPEAAHSSHPPGTWPVLCGTAWIESRWVHEWLYLGHLRDYFISLLEFTSAGPSLKEIIDRESPPPKLPTLQPPVPRPADIIRLEIEDE